VSLEAGRIASRILTRAKRGCCMNICTQQGGRGKLGIVGARRAHPLLRAPPVGSWADHRRSQPELGNHDSVKTYSVPVERTSSSSLKPCLGGSEGNQ
jgi:hypothetical protein